MAHITLPPDAPGIIGPMTAYPDTEVHLNGLAEALLRGLAPEACLAEAAAFEPSQGKIVTTCQQAHVTPGHTHYVAPPPPPPPSGCGSTLLQTAKLVQPCLEEP